MNGGRGGFEGAMMGRQRNGDALAWAAVGAASEERERVNFDGINCLRFKYRYYYLTISAKKYCYTYPQQPRWG